MPLDHHGRELLVALQAAFGASFYADVPDQVGVDDDGRLQVTIDAACRVVEVRVADIDALRRPPALADAVIGAVTAADAARAIASGQRSPHRDELAAEGAALVAGQVALRADPRTDAERQRLRLGGVRTSIARVDRVGRSSNGFVAVRIGSDAMPSAVEADEDWLGGTRPDRLRTALSEAFTAAYRPGAAMMSELPHRPTTDSEMI